MCRSYLSRARLAGVYYPLPPPYLPNFTPWESLHGEMVNPGSQKRASFLDSLVGKDSGRTEGNIGGTLLPWQLPPSWRVLSIGRVLYTSDFVRVMGGLVESHSGRRTEE